MDVLIVRVCLQCTLSCSQNVKRTTGFHKKSLLSEVTYCSVLWSFKFRISAVQSQFWICKEVGRGVHVAEQKF